MAYFNFIIKHLIKNLMKIYKFCAFGGCNTLMYIIHWNGLNFVKYEGSILFLVSPVSLWLLLLFFLSLSLFASGILSSWLLLFVSKMGSLFSPHSHESQNSVAHYYWVCSEYLGYYKRRAKAKRSIILFN